MEQNIRLLARCGVAAALALLVVTPAQASLQQFCMNSPENPTVILSLLGGAAAAYPVLRARLGRWRQRHSSDSGSDPSANRE